MPRNTSKGKRRVWLSYDLGLRGDYQALYEWLDEKGAKECGDSLATFTTSQTEQQLKVQLQELLGATSKARVYIVTGDGVGKFLLGARKAAPWAGYFQTAVENALDQ
ncbi:MAG TPA: hypothetical protein VN612_01675 [Acidobacteriaceae bacterium]|nr:hypothetical protein [Acidobacteriaceae bacterium]